MKSRASISSHPLHPLLIAFPIAFFTGSLLFDTVYLFNGDEALRNVTYYLTLAGIVGGFMAAIPGIIDYLYTVPPKSSGKKRAMKHGILNSINLVLFIIVFILKKNAEINYVLIVAMEAAGVGIMSIAGWMGGTLVYRNQIGVDPRYAHAGKWKEAYSDATSGTLVVADIDELQVNQMKLWHVKNKRIVIGRTEDGYVAFNDYCTHRGGSLAGGAMICGTVHCPWHGSQFDVCTGAVTAGPAEEKIEVYTVEEKQGKIYLDLDRV